MNLKLIISYEKNIENVKWCFIGAVQCLMFLQMRLDKSFIFICFDIMDLIDRNFMPLLVEDMCTETVLMH